MASRIIGVLGKKRHGKDTFAARLCNEHGFTRFAFADMLREAALKLDPLVMVEADEYHHFSGWAFREPLLFRLSYVVRDLGWEKAKELREVRRTLQHMGVGVRDLDEDFWVRAVMRQVEAHDGPVVITDVRFPNEAYAVVNHWRGRTLRVVNPRIETPDVEHISEIALDDYTPDHTVFNDGTIEDLHRQADRFAALS
ncbi:hypothetical protein HPO96_37035 [Kribbella sandramycini]|uniref:Deoxynucleoside monophosphate kinase n=1 Tax=Kribbella sandramycini TaxID=60450 RepID=A0A7Y4L7K4_9ACTN|nr:hypothetical protein [Kribbella sandramycini]MBB6564403.1 hypothetical protein [Kribbella sandramycini]NOL45865.1 hypothetical protein [Kribbella sandramycini]